MNVVDVLVTNLLVTVLSLPLHLTTLILTERLEVPIQNRLCTPEDWGSSVLQMSDYSTNRPICFERSKCFLCSTELVKFH